MPVSTPCLAAHVTPIPSLSPHWNALLDAQDDIVLPTAQDVFDILVDVMPLNIRLNERGTEASQRVDKESHDIWQLLEQLEPGIMEEMNEHHIDHGNDTHSAGGMAVQSTGNEKRKLGAKYGARKAQKTGFAMPESWLGPEEGEEEKHEDPATQQLCDLLDQVMHDDSLAETYWQDIIEEITSETQLLRAKAMLGQVPQLHIRPVLQRMLGSVQNLTQSGKWDDTTGRDDKSDAEKCLTIVIAALGFFSEENVGPAIYTDELMETIVDFVDGFINKIIIPALQEALKDQLAHANETAQGKRRKSREQSKDVRIGLKRKVDSISHVMLVLGDVLRLKIKVQDGQCITLTRICLSNFFVDFPAAVYHMQQACVGLMQSLFARYPDHREYIIQEVVVRAVSWKQVPSEFCFTLKAPKLGHIQMISALLLSLLQGCCDDSSPLQRSVTGDDVQAKHPAQMLAVMLITRLQANLNVKKIDKGSETGFKQLFQTFVRDVCWVVGAPEWPIATLVLKVLWKHTYIMCTTETYPSQYRLDASKLLGDIVVQIKQLSLDAGEIRRGGFIFEQENTVLHNKLVEQQTEVLNRCPLNDNVQQSPIEYVVGLGLDESDNFELAQRLVSQQLLLNYLVARSSKDQAFRHAKQNWIFNWSSELQKMPAGASRCYGWFWKDANYLAHRKIDGILDPSAQEAANYSAFLCSTTFDFAEISKPLLLLMMHPKMPQFRQRALKAISQIIELDPSVLRDEKVKQAVCEGMTDSAKSVRAEAVSLVGKFMCTSEELTLQYYESICQRCRDLGSSVRKAAMVILRDLLTKSKNKIVIDSACVAIIPLLKDESEDICKRTLGFLREMWFPSCVSDKNAGSSVLNKTERFEQMKSVIDAAHKSNNLVGRDSFSVTDILEEFLKDTLKAKKETIREFEEYCQEALNAIIRSQEIITSQAEANTNLLSLFRTLALLARVRPELIVKDVELLCKFLSNQEQAGGVWSKEQSEMIGTVATIYDCVLPHVQDPPELLIKYLMQDLPMLIQYAPTLPLLTISVKCLCTMVKSVGSSGRCAEKMYKVVQYFFAQQTNRLKDPQFKAKPKALMVAGLFCRFSDFKLNLESGKVSAIEDAKVREVFEKCIKEYVSHESLAFKRAGFACLGSLFVRIPRLIQLKEAQRVLSEALENSSEDIRSLAVTALTDFVGEDTSDTNATSLRNSIMQKFLDNILNCVYCEKDETAAAALKLVSTIHDRGQVHPQLCIPDMIGVQQRTITCSGVGFQVLKLINEKYPDYNSAQVFVAGVIKGFEHWQPGSPIGTERFVRAFELRLPNKKYVKDTIKTVVDKIKKGPEKADSKTGKSSAAGVSSNSKQAMIGDVDRKCFLISVISQLPFPDQDCAQEMISQAGAMGIHLGANTKINLKIAMEEREAHEALTGSPSTVVDIKVFEYMYQAARACILLDLKRFLQRAYNNKKDKSDFPVEVLPLKCENILNCPSGEDGGLQQVYKKLKVALQSAAEDKVSPGESAKKGGATGDKKGRPTRKAGAAAAAAAKAAAAAAEAALEAQDEKSTSESDNSDGDEDEMDDGNEHHALHEWMGD